MGTYFFATHREEIRTNNALWYRNGNSLLGDARHLHGPALWLLARAFDFVSFEGWDKGKNPAFMYPRLLALILRRRLVNYTRRVQADGAGSV